MIKMEGDVLRALSRARRSPTSKLTREMSSRLAISNSINVKKLAVQRPIHPKEKQWLDLKWVQLEFLECPHQQESTWIKQQPQHQHKGMKRCEIWTTVAQIGHFRSRIRVTSRLRKMNHWNPKKTAMLNRNRSRSWVRNQFHSLQAGSQMIQLSKQILSNSRPMTWVKPNRQRTEQRPWWSSHFQN